MENPIKMDDLGGPLFSETPNWVLYITLYGPTFATFFVCTRLDMFQRDWSDGGCLRRININIEDIDVLEKRFRGLTVSEQIILEVPNAL